MRVLMLIVVGLIVNASCLQLAASSPSFDPLIASQCRARCLSLYPWKLANSSTEHSADSSRSYRSMFNGIRRIQRASYSSSTAADPNHHGVKWNKVLEMCSKNTNCLLCSLPCDIPTSLLSNCKYLCKNQHPFCVDSCNLLSKLNDDEKYGACPSMSSPSESVVLSRGQCSNQARMSSIASALRVNGNDDLANKLGSNLGGQDLDDEITSSMQSCSRDSDCGDVKKCCVLNAGCPEQGSVCLKPKLNASNLPSIPHNLSIVERKKGKTVILSWESSYNKNKPTIFIVEGRWSLKPPNKSNFDMSSSSVENSMTKWGYLAQTVNNNWIILRNINRGRWYKFRVAAISKSGTLGHSKPTELFILSSSPKPPSNPQNLSIAQIYPTQDQTKISVDLTWLPPKRSDLPVSNYKLSWKLLKKPLDEIKSIESSDEDYTDEMNAEYLDAQSLNRFTVKNLVKNSIYSIELVAISKNEKETLVSGSAQIKVDTANVNLQALSSPLIAAESMFKISPKPNTDDFDEEEDDDLDEEKPKPIHQQQQQQQFNTRESPPLKLQPLITNLTVQKPFFLNGLVKAKLSWQLDTKSHPQPFQANNEASIINSVIDPPMYTISWFAIKCVKLVSVEQSATHTYVTVPAKNLPTLITATTINTHFEIYELKYNCDYVVNVRLAKLSSSASSINQKTLPQQQQQQQIASVQFKVPACNLIDILGRIRPICYSYNSELKTLTTDLTTLTSSQTKLIPTTTTTTTTTTTNQMSTLLPKVLNVRYRIADSSKASKLYAVEFTWSLPFTLNKKSFNGYQISIVPKAIPGFSMLFQTGEDEGFVSYGSVGAIVDKEQTSFVARQLRPAVKYIFQIQLIGVDNQSYGPPSSLEFLISDEVTKLDEKLLPRQQFKSDSTLLKNNGYEYEEDEDLAESSSASMPNFFYNKCTSNFYFSRPLSVTFLFVTSFVLFFNVHFFT